MTGDVSRCPHCGALHQSDLPGEGMHGASPSINMPGPMSPEDQHTCQEVSFNLQRAYPHGYVLVALLHEPQFIEKEDGEYVRVNTVLMGSLEPERAVEILKRAIADLGVVDTAGSA